MTEESAAGGGSAALAELHHLRKRIDTAFGFIPILGPLLLRRSPVHTPEEKRTLNLVSSLIGIILLGGLWLTLPSQAARTSELRGKVEAQFETLASLAEDYRTQNREYPDADAWRRSATQGDARFNDPWGRTFRYERTDDGFTIRTLGKDGAPGGSGEDADLSRHFSAPASPPAASR